MSVVALTAFITVYKTDGSELKFQNGKHAPVAGYNYLSFIYQGAAMNRSGDNLEASLILANNPLSMSYVKDFVDNKYSIKVETFLMTADFNKDISAANGGKISGELWLAAGMRYDPESIELILSSAIDAVGANAPQQTLTKRRCSHLPLTGQLQNL
jgi:phage-related protein